MGKSKHFDGLHLERWGDFQWRFEIGGTTGEYVESKSEKSSEFQDFRQGVPEAFCRRLAVFVCFLI